MNIAHILPFGAVYPLKKHNGRYEWALRLASAQARNDHNVTIYAGPSTETPDTSITFRSLSHPTDDKQANNRALFELAFKNADHDIYHSHFDALHYDVADQTKRPVVVTQHWFPTEEIAAAVKNNTRDNVIAVPVTRFMAEADRTLGIPASNTIYHGIDLRAFPVSYAPRNERLLFVGRIAPHKGVREVVRAARQAGAALDIVGKLNAKDQPYWDEILPDIDGNQIAYLGPKSQPEVAELMVSAKAMIFLPTAKEAFGQTIIESQACGTPVILNDLGANIELVDDWVSGRIVHDETEVTDAIDAVSGMNPRDCRAFAERFDLSKMVASYDALYQSLRRTIR